MKTLDKNSALSLINPLNAVGVRFRQGVAWSATLCMLGIFSATPVAADNVLAGIDLWQTVSPTSKTSLSPCTIPADFFGPGSDPFAGTIQFEGQPLGGPFGKADTIVERLRDATLPVCEDPSSSGPGTCSSDTVPIEIVALSLKSAAPITVTFNGGMDPEQWNVKACLSDAAQTPGSMIINHDCINGGTFTSSLPVLFKLIFTRGAESLTLDAGDPGVVCDPNEFKFTASGNWVHDPAPVAVVRVTASIANPVEVDGNCDGNMETLTKGTTNFFPGIEAICEDSNGNPSPCNECCAEFCSAEKNLPVTEMAPSATHTVTPPGPGVPVPPPPTPTIPTMSAWALVVLTLFLLVGAKIYFGRRRSISVGE